MPAKTPQEQYILVTGASGFIGSHIVHTFLSAGYRVRACVRNVATAAQVVKTHSSLNDRLSFAFVPDISVPNAFDLAVKSCDGIIHVASPFAFSAQDNERDFLLPAINGTVGLLKSVKKNAPDVKRVVVTSSFAAIVDLSKGSRQGYQYTEKDWNPCTYEQAKTGSGSFAYCASKKFAEEEVWKFVKGEHVTFDVATICPPMVYGPLIHPTTNLENLNTTCSADPYRLINGSVTSPPPTTFPLAVDVRDVATAHLKAFEVPEASNQRFAVTLGNYTYRQVCDVIREEFVGLRERVPEGEMTGKEVGSFGLSGGKAREVLGGGV